MKNKRKPEPKIEEFLKHQRANSIKDNTIRNNRSKLEMANDWKPIADWSKDDVIGYIIHMKDGGYKDSYIEMTKSVIKAFLIFGGKEDYVKDITIKMPEKNLRPSDILTPNEIDMLIEVAPDNRWKALIALLFESGARISELLNIRVSDILETDKGMVIHVPATKTGEKYRPCLCVMSGQYIRNHQLYPLLKSTDKLFSVSKVLVWLRLKEFAKKAGITKPISAHMLRHAQATYMARKQYNESIIREKLGWTNDSKMVARYINIDGTDVINATLEKEGIKPQLPRELIKPIKIAEPIAIADKSLEINRLQATINELSSKNHELEIGINRLYEHQDENLALTAQVSEMSNVIVDYDTQIEELKKQMKAQQEYFEKTLLELVKNEKKD